jgi:endonuclease VIII
MPEGPSIVILREETRKFVGKIIRAAEGNSRLEKEHLVGERILSIRSFGKQFLIELPSLTIRIHFMLFGSYSMNARKEDRVPRLRLSFARGMEMNFYACSVRYVTGDLDELYDWRTDVLSDAWDSRLALRRLRAKPATLVCDALLDQDIFAGVGNIIKNEVLFRMRVHPLSTIGGLPPAKLRAVTKDARDYSFLFLEWKKRFVLRKHWQAHNKSICPRDHVKFSFGMLGLRHRRSFYCELCQKRYTR